MKKIIAACLVLLQVLTFQTALAAGKIDVQSSSYKAYLEEVGLTHTELVDYLENYENTMFEEFESVDDLREYLGRRLSEEVLQELLSDYELTEDELTELLIENGDLSDGERIEDVFYFENFLDETIQTAGDYYTEINDETIRELWESYDFESRAEFDQFLKEHDLRIEDYESIEELDEAIYSSIELPGLEEELQGVFDEIGITEEELLVLSEHLAEVSKRNPNLDSQLMELGDRMMSISDFERVDEISEEDMKEMISIYSEMMNLLELQPKYYLLKDGIKKELSLQTMMTIQDVNGADLLVELYNLDNQFLLDLTLTAEMIGSDLIVETGQDLKQTAEAVTQVKEKTEKPVKTVKTVKGARMPETAGFHADWMILGGLMMGAAYLISRKLRASA
ncbi:processed acidic surface protein [Bacillus mangrovi]|uniref:Processed acidic surface protein n=1 Tax=Metabacillus mangrovi TaxID=1491830 RepID=A0A7X2S710_9BACI|nr:processed acidic surface protein [Metabacillus mangrovi]MTH54812.1 processed acidic surface protein [Metabacillus mangrovi]